MATLNIEVIHVSTDTTNRTATFTVDGVSVTRQIADGIGVDELPAHLEALAQGLQVEKETELKANPPLV